MEDNAGHQPTFEGCGLIQAERTIDPLWTEAILFQVLNVQKMFTCFGEIPFMLLEGELDVQIG